MSLDHVASAYKLAAQAHIDRPKEIDREYRRKLGIGPDDPWPDRNEFDEFDPVDRAYEDIDAASTTAWYGARIVRRAFAISLFHLWERYIVAETGAKKYGHPKGWITQHGHPECAKPIWVLQKVANCAKHGPGGSCEELYRARPDLFPKTKCAEDATSNRLDIDHKMIEEFIEVLRQVTA